MNIYETIKKMDKKDDPFGFFLTFKTEKNVGPDPGKNALFISISTNRTGKTALFISISINRKSE